MYRSRLVGILVLGVALAALLGRAVTVFSIGARPLIYRVTVNNNDLDSVEGIGIPGRLLKLWYKQRNFREGNESGSDAFKWCAWKNHGNAVLLGSVVVGPDGTWRLDHLHDPNTVSMFPAGPSPASCLGGLYTQLLPQVCNLDGTGCTTFIVPTMHWMNVTHLTDDNASATASVSGADQAGLAVADGPNDGPEASDVVDVDQNGVDTTVPGFTQGQRVTWKCGVGGTTSCPSIAVHDGSTVVGTDPEYGFVLGMLQAHREGGSIIAGASIPRGQDLGFTANVNVRFRGKLDLNLGCDRPRFFEFSVPPTH